MEINATLLGEIITFAILVLFTLKFVWPPLNKMLEERAEKIASGLAAAEKGKLELQNAENRILEELNHAQVRVTEIIKNAERRADDIILSAKNKALKESEKIITESKLQIEQEYMRAKEHLRTQVAGLVIQGAQQILKVEVDVKRHEAILADIITKI